MRKLMTLPGALLLVIGPALLAASQAWALSVPTPTSASSLGARELNCFFPIDKGQGCEVTLRHCLSLPGAPTAEAPCKTAYLVKCDGHDKDVFKDPIIQDINQNGIGIALVGADENRFPRLAVDQSLTESYKDAFAHLYLSAHERLSGRCSSLHQQSIGGLQ